MRPASHPHAAPVCAPAWLIALILAAVAMSSALTPAPARADPPGVALMGFDAVAYFQQHEARPGAGNIALRWRGLIWHFATPENRAAFEANPRAFVPQFGGLCPEALARGERVAGDPRHWTILDGKLYLAGTADALQRLTARPEGVVPEAAQAFRRMQRP